MWCTPYGLRKAREKGRGKRSAINPHQRIRKVWIFSGDARRECHHPNDIHIYASLVPAHTGHISSARTVRHHVQYNTYVGKKGDVQLGLWPVMVAQSRGKGRTACSHQGLYCKGPIHVAMCWKYRFRQWRVRYKLDFPSLNAVKFTKTRFSSPDLGFKCWSRFTPDSRQHTHTPRALECIPCCSVSQTVWGGF